GQRNPLGVACGLGRTISFSGGLHVGLRGHAFALRLVVLGQHARTGGESWAGSPGPDPRVRRGARVDNAVCGPGFVPLETQRIVGFTQTDLVAGVGAVWRRAVAARSGLHGAAIPRFTGLLFSGGLCPDRPGLATEMVAGDV